MDLLIRSRGFTPALPPRGKVWEGPFSRGRHEEAEARLISLREVLGLRPSPSLGPLIATARCTRRVIVFVSCSLLFLNRLSDDKFGLQTDFTDPLPRVRERTAEGERWEVCVCVCVCVCVSHQLIFLRGTSSWHGICTSCCPSVQVNSRPRWASAENRHRSSA